MRDTLDDLSTAAVTFQLAQPPLRRALCGLLTSRERWSLSWRGRLIFAMDATISRQPTWDLALGLQANMFRAVKEVGGLDVQLVYFRGMDKLARVRGSAIPKPSRAS